MNVAIDARTELHSHSEWPDLFCANVFSRPSPSCSIILICARSRKRGTDPAMRRSGAGAFGSYQCGVGALGGEGREDPSPKPLCGDLLATDGFRASGRQHPVQDRHADGSLGLLRSEAARPRPMPDQRFVAAHCRFDQPALAMVGGDLPGRSSAFRNHLQVAITWCRRHPLRSWVWSSSTVGSPLRCDRPASLSSDRWRRHHTHHRPSPGQSGHRSDRAAAPPGTDRRRPIRQ